MGLLSLPWCNEDVYVIVTRDTRQFSICTPEQSPGARGVRYNKGAGIPAVAIKWVGWPLSNNIFFSLLVVPSCLIVHYAVPTGTGCPGDS